MFSSENVCLPERKVYFGQESEKIDVDLANGVSESIWNLINRLPKTLLFRLYRRRAHHLPPDPNILKGQTEKLKI